MSRDFTAQEILGIGWPAETARKWLSDLAKHMAADAKHIRANLEVAKSQEEFELLLEHGLGLEEEEIAGCVRRVMGRAAEEAAHAS